MIISMSISEFLTLIFFFLFFGSLIYQTAIYFKNKKEKRAVAQKESNNLDNIDFHVDDE